MTNSYDFQSAMKEMRIRVNSLEETVIKNETKLSFMTTIASLAAAAAAIEICSHFIN